MRWGENKGGDVMNKWLKFIWKSLFTTKCSIPDCGRIRIFKWRSSLCREHNDGYVDNLKSLGMWDKLK